VKRTQLNRSIVRVGIVLFALAAVGCGGATQSGDGTGMGQRVPGEVVWSQVIELTEYERQLFDSRKLEIQPVAIGVDAALIEILIDGAPDQFELRTSGPLSTEIQPPYHFELLDTSPTPKVRIRVTKYAKEGERVIDRDPDAEKLP